MLATGAFPVRESFGNLYEGNAEYELLASFTNHYAPYYNTMDNRQSDLLKLQQDRMATLAGYDAAIAGLY